MTVKKAFWLAGFSIFASSLAMSSMAFAQEQTPAPETDKPPTATIEEIVVSAQKREQSLQNVPISINAFTGKSIDALGAQSAGDLDTFTPGLSINDTSVTQPSFSIRGVQTDDFGIGTEPAVGIFIDGVYSGRSGGSLIFFNDIERVEVLKGPQGTLFGRNTSAGALSIITRKPSDRLEASATVRFGNYNKRRVDVMGNVPIADGLFLRVNGVDNSRRGYLTDAVTGANYQNEKNWSGRAALRFEPSDQTDFTLSFDHDDTDQGGPTAVGISPFALSQDPFGPFANDTTGSRESRILNAGTLTANHDFGPVTLTSLTSFKKFETHNRQDEDGTNLRARYLDSENIEQNRGFYQELRLAHSGDRLNWVAGISYFEERGQQTLAVTGFTDSIDTTLNTVAGFPIFTTLDSVGLPVFDLSWREDMINFNHNKSYAAFSDVTWAATDKLNLTVGLRYTKDRKQFSWFNDRHISPGLSLVTAPGALYNAIIGNTVFPDAAIIDVNTFFDAVVGTDIVFDSGALEGVEFSRSESFSDVSPRFVIDYKPSEHVMVFASASRGYKAGGFNSVEINSFFRPESVWNFEGGVKSELFDRRLRLNISGYYFKYKDRQSISLEGVSGSGIPQYVTLSGDSEAKGIDFEAQFAATPSLTFSTSAGYIDSTWVKRTERGIDISGQPTGEPKLRLILGAHYDHEFAGDGSLFADSSYSYTSPTRINDAVRDSDNSLKNNPTFGDLVDFSKLERLRSRRTIVNARIGWRSPGDHFSVSLFAENLFDVRTPRTLNTVTADVFGTPYVRIDEPRFWGVELRSKF